MKVLLYAEGLKVIGVSGLGKAIQHQMKALELENIPYTTDINDNYDIAHINTYFFKSYFLARKLKKKGIKIVYHAHSTEDDLKKAQDNVQKMTDKYTKEVDVLLEVKEKDRKL